MLKFIIIPSNVNYVLSTEQSDVFSNNFKVSITQNCIFKVVYTCLILKRFARWIHNMPSAQQLRILIIMIMYIVIHTSPNYDLNMFADLRNRQNYVCLRLCFHRCWFCLFVCLPVC